MCIIILRWDEGWSDEDNIHTHVWKRNKWVLLSCNVSCILSGGLILSDLSVSIFKRELFVKGGISIAMESELTWYSVHYKALRVIETILAILKCRAQYDE